MCTWEHDLISQVQEGNTGAFTPLVQRYEHCIQHSIFQVLGDVDVVADVTQEAFIATFEKIHLYNPEHRFFSWVYRIAYNGALNRINRRKLRQQFFEDDIRCPGPSPDILVEEHERDAFVKQALAALVLKYRVMLILRHYLDFSYDEIANITGLPVTTVRSRLHTARVLLKEELLPTVGGVGW